MHCTTVAEMTAHAWLVRQLTPAITDDVYLALLREMVPHRYGQFVVVEGDRAIALSGYWIGHKFYCGRYLEVDNFVVDEAHRSRGIGQLLLDHLIEHAREEGCAHLMLDAYLQNNAAHRFYERNGFTKRGYHFMRAL